MTKQQFYLLRKIYKKLTFLCKSPMLFVRILIIYLHDAIKFIKHSTVKSSIFYGYSFGLADKKEGITTLVTVDTHKIEKGLALREPRVNFGLAVCKRMLENIKELNKNSIPQDTISCLCEYRKFLTIDQIQKEKDLEIVKSLDEFLEKYKSSDPCGGTLVKSSHEILAASKIELEKFFNSRHSIRNFDSKLLEKDHLEKAVRMAQKTPSVCNRQSWRVYSYRDKKNISEALKYQKGNAGFTNHVGGVLIVTSDIRTFISPEERNQCWIDGGLFSMSLVYALHSLGIGSCCLNWCVDHANDRAMRKFTGIPDYENIIMYIACGYLLNEFKVAQSNRYPLEKMLTDLTTE